MARGGARPGAGRPRTALPKPARPCGRPKGAISSELAAPWGITLASAGFGPFGGDLLVGNFSYINSEINAFNPMTGAFVGTIPIDDGGAHGGLWALDFGNAGQNGSPNTLYFTDGVNSEADGLFAAITPAAVPEPSGSALLATALAFFGVRRARSRRRVSEAVRAPSGRLEPPPSIVMIEPVV